MRRKIYNELLKWKEEAGGREALLIEGARRVGKSYIVEEFAKENYKSYVLIDFNKTPDEIKDIFQRYLDNLDQFFELLSNYYGVKLYERETLFIFDEVQLFPRARSAIKYLVADGRYDYIETGSLISIKENTEGILIPSEERAINLEPMDFEEFLWAMGEDSLLDLIREKYEAEEAIEELIHRRAMDLFRRYMIVGGMPQAVEKYVETRDFEEADKVKRNILNLYRGDIDKHAGNYKMKVRMLFDEIPAQLKKHEKKFQITALSKDAKKRDYEDAFMWLADSKIVNIAFNTTEPTVGLKLSEDASTYKLYMGDTGLLISHAFDENGIISNEVYKNILFDRLEINEGMIIENVVAQMLKANGHELYFYSRYSKEQSENRMEIDFLITRKNIGRKHNVSAIEVKSSKNYTISSLDKYRNKFKEQLGEAFVIHSKNFAKENGVVYLPFYMVPLL